MSDTALRLLQRFEAIFNHKLFSLGGVEVTPATLTVFFVTVGTSLLLGRMAKRALLRIMLSRARSGSEGSAYAVGRISQYLVFAAGTLVALETVGISLSTLAALGAVFAVGLGFGLQNITQNFVSGLILLFERPISKGDVVIVDGTFGIVDEISIRATRVMTFDQIAMIVPNNKLVSEVVENRSEPTRTYRVRIDVRVAYGTHSRVAEETLLEIARQHDAVLDDPEPSVFFVDFGDSSLDFQLCVWLDDPSAALGVGSDLRHAITQTFAERGIVLPVPQRHVSWASGAPVAG